jgi:hypothetical protein
MALPNIYSRRKRLAAGMVDVYQYEDCSQKLRRQIIQIIKQANDRVSTYDDSQRVYNYVAYEMRKELGVAQLSDGDYSEEEFEYWFMSHQEMDDIVDSIEFCCLAIKHLAQTARNPAIYSAFCDEINARMKEAGFGFQIEGVEILKIGSTYIHSESVIPALHLLSHPKYVAVNQEFRQAHHEYRIGQYEDCIHDCGNALESLLKVILTEKGWAFNPTDGASKLLTAAFTNNLIPAYMQTQFTALRTVLESGTPTVRNKNAGHGAGTAPRNIPAYLAEYQLHQTAAALLLLGRAAEA